MRCGCSDAAYNGNGVGSRNPPWRGPPWHSRNPSALPEAEGSGRCLNPLTVPARLPNWDRPSRPPRTAAPPGLEAGSGKRKDFPGRPRERPPERRAASGFEFVWDPSGWIIRRETRDCKPSLQERLDDGDSRPSQSGCDQCDDGGCSGEMTSPVRRRSTTFAGLSVPLPCHGSASESFTTNERRETEK